MKRVLALFGEQESVLDDVALSMRGRKVTFGDLAIPEDSSLETKHYIQTSCALPRKY